MEHGSVGLEPGETDGSGHGGQEYGMELAVTMMGAVGEQGAGYGTGNGYGYEDHAGRGGGRAHEADVVQCLPEPVHVTIEQLYARNVCLDHARVFMQVFPAGAPWPGGVTQALDAGLEVPWVCRTLGLLMPKGEDRE